MLNTRFSTVYLIVYTMLIHDALLISFLKTVLSLVQRQMVIFTLVTVFLKQEWHFIFTHCLTQHSTVLNSWTCLIRIMETDWFERNPIPFWTSGQDFYKIGISSFSIMSICDTNIVILNDRGIGYGNQHF